MAYIPRSSFVPKEVSSSIPVQIKKKRSIRLFSFLATSMLFLSALSAVGVYFYKGLLDDELDSAQAKLNEISQDDDQKKIEEIQQYDRKLTIASQLLENHIAPSRIFAELEMLTKETVQFQDLKFKYDPGFDAVLELQGVTKEFASVALQEMEFHEGNPFSDFVVSDIGNAESAEKDDVSTPKQEVRFTIKGLFKENVLKYRGTESTTGITPTSTLDVPVSTIASSTVDNVSSQTL